MIPAQGGRQDSRNTAEAAPKAVGTVASDSAAEPDRTIVEVSRRAEAPAPAAIVLAEPVAAPAPPPAAPAMGQTAIASARERDDSADEVIVTARRAAPTSNWKASAPPRHPQARRTSMPGDWNACTVNDPARSLESCTELSSGPVAEGLSRAWRGDLDGAIAAFDQAIAGSQQPGLAYLNRGLVYERRGDHDRALADLDRAVRQAPGSARAYYNRSLALYRNGDKDRAAADADRATELDPRYGAVIR
jgi:tetratricopeptide (TPR) repeat protein